MVVVDDDTTEMEMSFVLTLDRVRAPTMRCCVSRMGDDDDATVEGGGGITAERWRG